MSCPAGRSIIVRRLQSPLLAAVLCSPLAGCGATAIAAVIAMQGGGGAAAIQIKEKPDLVVSRLRVVTPALEGAAEYDLLVGTAAGTLAIHRRSRGGDSPVFDAATFLEVGGQTLDLVTDAAPALGDLDGDGAFDLVVGNADGDVFLCPNLRTSHDPAFGRARRLSAGGRDLRVPGKRARPAIADLNGDGFPDLLVGDGTGALTLFTNAGKAGTATYAEGVALQEGGAAVRVAKGPASPSFGDLDGDGAPDLYLGDGDGNVLVFPGKPGGGLSGGGILATAVGGGTGPLAGAAGEARPAALDYDLDGRTDLLVGGSDGKLRVLLNRTATLANPIHEAPFAIQVQGQDLVAAGGAFPSVGDLGGRPRTRLGILHEAEDTSRRKVHLEVTVTNQGDLAAGASTLKVFLSRTKDFVQEKAAGVVTGLKPKPEDILLLTIPVKELKPFTSTRIASDAPPGRQIVQVAIPRLDPNKPDKDEKGDPVPEAARTIEEGFFYFTALADAGEAVAEFSEANNGTTTPEVLQLRRKEAVDDRLAVASVAGPQFGVTGRQVQLEVTVANLDPKEDQASVTLDLYLVDSRDILDPTRAAANLRPIQNNRKQVTIPAVPRGTTVQVSIPFTLPAKGDFDNSLSFTSSTQRFHFVAVTRAAGSTATQSGDNVLASAEEIQLVEQFRDIKTVPNIPLEGINPIPRRDEQILTIGKPAFFQFTATKPMLVELGAISTSDMDPVIDLLGFNDNTGTFSDHLAHDDDSGIPVATPRGAKNALLRYSVSPRTYLIVVRTYRNETTGRFDLFLRQFATQADRNRVSMDVERVGLHTLETLVVRPKETVNDRETDRLDQTEVRLTLRYSARLKVALVLSDATIPLSELEASLVDLQKTAGRGLDTSAFADKGGGVLEGDTGKAKPLPEGVYYLTVKNQGASQVAYDLVIEASPQEAKKE